jgi:hypothetical protein
MPVTKKKILSNKKRQKKLPPVIVVTHTVTSIEENPFPEKLEKAKEILSRTKFMDR